MMNASHTTCDLEVTLAGQPEIDRWRIARHELTAFAPDWIRCQQPVGFLTPGFVNQQQQVRACSASECGSHDSACTKGGKAGDQPAFARQRPGPQCMASRLAARREHESSSQAE